MSFAYLFLVTCSLSYSFQDLKNIIDDNYLSDTCPENIFPLLFVHLLILLMVSFVTQKFSIFIGQISSTFVCGFVFIMLRRPSHIKNIKMFCYIFFRYFHSFILRYFTHLEFIFLYCVKDIILLLSQTTDTCRNTICNRVHFSSSI